MGPLRLGTARKPGHSVDQAHSTRTKMKQTTPARPPCLAPTQTVCGVVELPDIVDESVHFVVSGDKMVLSFDAKAPGETAGCLERYRAEMVLPGGVAAEKVRPGSRRGRRSCLRRLFCVRRGRGRGRGRRLRLRFRRRCCLRNSAGFVFWRVLSLVDAMMLRVLRFGRALCYIYVALYRWWPTYVALLSLCQNQCR